MDYLLVFSAAAILDYLWSEYIAAVGKSSPFIAGAWAVPLYVVGAFATISIVANHWLLIPASLGSFVGTFVSVWRARRKESISN